LSTGRPSGDATKAGNGDIRILYNATSACVGGGLSYATAQVAALARALSGGEIVVFASQANGDELRKVDNVRVRVIHTRGVLWRVLWEQLSLPFHARKYDVVVSPGNFAVLCSPRPQVVVLQNPNYVGHGRKLAHNRHARRYFEVILSFLSMQRADAVIVISDALMAEVASEPLLRRIRAHVIRSGAPAAPASTVVGDYSDVVDDHSGVRQPYILSVANGYAHKRLEDIASAFSRTTVRGSLVFVGSISTAMRHRIELSSGSRVADLVFCGAVGDRSRVDALYHGASAAVSASELEAFPLTPHEAGNAGCPLVLSDIPPHREVAGDNARYVPVGDVIALAEVLERALRENRRTAVWSWPISWEEHGVAALRLIQSVAPKRRPQTDKLLKPG